MPLLGNSFYFLHQNWTICGLKISKIIQKDPKFYCGETKFYRNGICWINKKNSIKGKKLINKTSFDFQDLKNFLNYVQSN